MNPTKRERAAEKRAQRAEVEGARIHGQAQQLAKRAAELQGLGQVQHAQLAAAREEATQAKNDRELIGIELAHVQEALAAEREKLQRAEAKLEACKRTIRVLASSSRDVLALISGEPESKVQP